MHRQVAFYVSKASYGAPSNRRLDFSPWLKTFSKSLAKLSFVISCGSVATLFSAPLVTAASPQDAKSIVSDATNRVDRSASNHLSRVVRGPYVDETVEGKKRLREIETQANRLKKERDQVDNKRRPYVVRRDSMMGDSARARERIGKHTAAAIPIERQLASLEAQISWTRGSLQKALRSQQSKLRTSLNTLTREIKKDRVLVENTLPEIQALDQQIASFDRRLETMQDEVAECRKQWLDVRQLHKKYSEADFEGVERVVDDWIVLDGQWPEAFAWAALCAYEQEKWREAAEYVDKARKLRAEQFPAKRLLPQFEALAGLILVKQLGQRSKGDAAISSALRHVDRNSDWEAHFMLGRCYFDRPEGDVRAKTHLLHALKIEADCDCAKLWLGRLQTTSTLDAVRDVDAGIARLEERWLTSGQRSWRLACFLAEAYTAAQRTMDADAMWSVADRLAPADQKDRIARYQTR